MSTGIIILAAGESARMGSPKQLLDYHGKTLLRHTIDTALSLRGAPVVVVLGANAGKIRPTLTGLPVLVAENAGWREGMSSSVRTGLHALLAAHPSISAALFLLCDQPLLSPKTLRDLAAAHGRTGRAIVASDYDGVLGVPALFDHSLFPDLLALEGPGGAKQVISIYRNDAIGVPFDDGAVDIDTPADYACLSRAVAEPISKFNLV